MPKRLTGARAAARHFLCATGYYQRRVRQQPYRGVAVLAYHGVPAAQGPQVPSPALHVTAQRLDEHCRLLRNLCRVLTFDEWHRAVAGDIPMPERAVLVTFDDGYASMLTEALPVLEKHGIPAVMFVCTDPIARGRRFWFDAMAIRSGPDELARAQARSGEEWRALTAAYDEPARRDDPMRPLTIRELRTLAASPLITIGAHTVTHPLLARAPIEVQRAEIAESRATLEGWIDRSVTAFAYPNGLDGDFTADTIQEVRAAGFDHAFSIGYGFAGGASSRFEQPRFLVLQTLNGATLGHQLAFTWPRLARPA